MKLEEIDKKISNLKQEIEDIEVSYSRLEKVKKIEEKQLQSILESSQLNLTELYKTRRQIVNFLPKVERYLESQNLLYICNYSPENTKDEDEVLLCKIHNIDITEVNYFLKELSQKVFLAAPTTQIFLFIPQVFRTLLFREQQGKNDYQSLIKSAKSTLPGFFTYDFLAVDLLIESFKSARDRDFIVALETGEYGNNYKELLQDLNLILIDKKITLDKDFLGVTFKLENSFKTIELYPEDLSHGELKRLSIYMWIKYHNIKDSIVLMDEIELALHPDWQYKIVSDLEQWASSNQYILATHSYELCQALTPAHVKELEPKLLKESVQKSI